MVTHVDKICLTIFFSVYVLKADWCRVQLTDWLLILVTATLLNVSGAYGAAVLYRKKDDDSLVILKEISLHDLTATERQMAMNEVCQEITDMLFSSLAAVLL